MSDFSESLNHQHSLDIGGFSTDFCEITISWGGPTVVGVNGTGELEIFSSTLTNNRGVLGDNVGSVGIATVHSGGNGGITFDGEGTVIRELRNSVHVATDLSPDQIRAYRLADNRTGKLSTWDFQILPIELAALQDAGYEMDIMAFDDKELAQTLRDETPCAVVCEALLDCTLKFWMDWWRATANYTQPETSYLVHEAVDAVRVAGDGVIIQPTPYNTSQPSGRFAYWSVHSLSQSIFDRLQGRAHAFCHAMAMNGIPALLPRPGTLVGEAQKVESIGSASIASFTAFDRIAAELD